METRSASDVAQLPQNSKQFPEKHSCEREKSSPFHIRMWGRLTVERPHFVRPLADFCSLVNLALHYSTTTVVSVVCCLGQFGHIRKKRWRLADEETHVR